MARELHDIAAEALDSLEDISEEESDALWAEEAERRYAEYKPAKYRRSLLTKCLPACEPVNGDAGSVS